MPDCFDGIQAVGIDDFKVIETHRFFPGNFLATGSHQFCGAGLAALPQFSYPHQRTMQNQRLSSLLRIEISIP